MVQLLTYGGLLLFSAKEIIVLLISYGLGCFSMGYYLVRLCTGQDIRGVGSGSAGATNVGRTLGVQGFTITFLVDLTKGAIAVWIAVYFELRPLGIVLAMIAVVSGHIWPVQMRFRGGKGIATSLGALVVFDLLLIIVVTVIFSVMFALLRKLTLSGLIAVAMSPAVALLMGQPATGVIGITALTIIVLFAHRADIRAIVSRTARETAG